ncbi:piRNA biogenesis protein EXD1 [Trichonephila clavata]|uniref:PiRNA biogenesis protein EXD1 n=1 Tax=Trichonephila clavata TaxID=2740835 RepID=A0A8X6EZ51_TRICU|nr:piRNA biogenesis protein EXD1 [Trichonephila clavata]
MLSVTDCLDLLNCTIRFTLPDGKFEGLLLRVMPEASMIAVANTVLLPCQTKFRTLHFDIQKITNLEVIKRPDPPQEKDEAKEEKPTSTDPTKYMELMYEKYGKATRNSAIRTFMDEMFDFENEDIPDLSLEEGEYFLKLPPKLFNCLPPDSFTIDSIDYDFHVVIEHIGNLDSIGVSLEGLKISRSEAHTADSVVMMQQNKGSKVIQRVNTLNACLNYYLDVPDEYLYESLCFDENEESINYYGRRPLRHKFQDIMIKNVMYLRMLKDKIKKAILLPLQKVTNPYLDVVQNSSNEEFQICPPDTKKLPLETCREGVKIVRYDRYKEIQPVLVSGPPYRKLANPTKDYENDYLKKNLEKQCSESESDKNIDQISVDFVKFL